MPTGKNKGTLGDIHPMSQAEKDRISNESRSFKRAGVNPKTMGETESLEKLKRDAGSATRFNPGKNLGKYLHPAKKR